MAGNLLSAFQATVSRIAKRVERVWTDYTGYDAPWRSRADDTREETYLAALTSATPSERWRAAAGLGRNPLRSEEAIAALVQALADEEQFVRWHAAEALARQEQGKVFPVLVAALNDSSPLRRAGAAEALGRAGGEGAGLTLVKHLTDPAPEVRIAVVEAVGALKDPTLATLLLPLLHDFDADVVRAAARALSRLGNPLAAPFLAQALVMPDQPVLVRRALAAALARAGHPDTQQQLLVALRDTDAQVRAYAASALGQVGGEAAISPLAELKSDKNRLIRGTVSDRAARAIELLERRGRRASPQIGEKYEEEPE